MAKLEKLYRKNELILDNVKDGAVAEFMELLQLAEDTSSKLTELRNKIFNIALLSSISILLIGLLYIIGINLLKSSSQLFVINGFLIGVFILIGSNFVYQFFIFKKYMRIESKVAKKIYKIIGPFKSSIKDDISILKLATIEMRLSRLEFDFLEKE